MSSDKICRPFGHICGAAGRHEFGYSYQDIPTGRFASHTSVSHMAEIRYERFCNFEVGATPRSVHLAARETLNFSTPTASKAFSPRSEDGLDHPSVFCVIVY